ncbi:MAG: phosphatase PAP2 family protein, partial [Clostridia bacterium]|nr:phosphatase PAP2 family protein [Clostridia bacterium]
MDIQILLFLQDMREALGGCLNGFFAFLTTVSVDYYIMLPGLILFWAINKRSGLIGLGSYGVACYSVSALKSTFCVYRPWIRSDLIKPLPEVMSGATGYSFPSGHSASVSSMYGGLIAVYRKRKGLCILLGTVIALTMFSRLYVGVHPPQDLLVGLLVGGIGTAVALLVDRFVTLHPDLDWVV